MSKKLIWLLSASVILSSCGQKQTESSSFTQLKMVEVPLMIPGTSEVIQVPQTILLDNGFGIKTYPKPVESVEPRLQKLSQATAKILSLEGMGTGFFISEDGLFLTNEHVIEIKSCTRSRCPGIKIIRDYHVGGAVKEYTSFEILAQADSDENLDFTLLKVKLDEGEKVPYLKLELNKEAYDFQNDQKTYKAFGHPSGATLRVSNVKPLKVKDYSIELLGLLIPGNSGGPMISEESGKVVGLVKAIRPSYVRIDSETSAQTFRAMATSILDIVRHLQTHNIVPEIVARLNSDSIELEALEEDAAEKVVIPKEVFPAPSKKLFKAALRKEISDPSASRALSELQKYIGTQEETTTLDLMVETSEMEDGPINRDLLSELFKAQVKLGRPLRYSEGALKLISEAVQSQEESSMDSTKIYFNYFNPEEKAGLQKKCLDTFQGFPNSEVYTLLTCASLKKADGTSAILSAVKNFKQADYKDEDDFGMVMAMGMFVGLAGSPDTEEKIALIELAKFLDSKNNDVQVIMNLDSMIIDAALGISGPGSFKKTFPN
jgi:hypothetical protein